MRPLTLAGLALGLAVGLAFAAPPARGADEPDKVKFETVDLVELHGAWYPSKDGKKAPCVLLLHKIGGSSHEDGWDALAKDLQKAGYAVLSFDFRGHGDSTGVSPGFWQERFNASSLKVAFNPNKPKESISISDFNPGYCPVLVNDIAAAKLFLDHKNDSGECNSANLILIGAEDGATLGAMWLNAELYRHRVTGPLKFAPTPEGKDVAACVWLTISPVIGKNGVRPPLGSWITYAGHEKKVPMAFVYGEKDTNGANVSNSLFEKIKPDKDAKSKLTGKKPIEKTNLAGHGLLSKEVDARKWIVETYLKTVKDEKVAPAWEEHDFEKAAFVWSFQGAVQPIQAKLPGEKTIAPVPLKELGLR
jgi:pimeloyl-ACP methyl ester carboxylesterase